MKKKKKRIGSRCLTCRLQVDICEYYAFDGWLVNIENAISPDSVPKLKDFVCVLTEEMHARLPGSQVCAGVLVYSEPPHAVIQIYACALHV